MAFKVNLSEADKKKVAGLNEKQRQKYLSGNKVNNSSSLNNGTPLPTRDVLSGIGNAQVRNNAILGLDLFNRGNAFGAGSKATEQKYREIAASPEIQELARGQSYLKKELPQSGLMLGGDPVARNAAIRTQNISLAVFFRHPAYRSTAATAALMYIRPIGDCIDWP